MLCTTQRISSCSEPLHYFARPPEKQRNGRLRFSFRVCVCVCVSQAHVAALVRGALVQFIHAALGNRQLQNVRFSTGQNIEFASELQGNRDAVALVLAIDKQ